MKTKLTIGSVLLAALVAISISVSPHRIGPAYLYPTVGGSLNPNVTQDNIHSTICVSGWTSTIRPPVSYTNKLKLQQLNGKGNPADYEEDHFYPLEIGGDPTSPDNLWPEAYNAGARQKDIVETFLNHQVCSGNLTLASAQAIILKDWYAAYLDIKGTPVPSQTDD
jgi:hypothetical protein